jgi:thiol-disulfide isomerase/thioredoxin
MKNFFTLLLTALVAFSGFSQENMAFQAKIANKNGDILYIKDGRTTVQEIKLNDKGVFQGQFPIKEGKYQLFDGVEYAQLFLKNGYDLKMTMDASKFDESIKFEGKGAKENNYLAKRTLDDAKIDFQGMVALDEAGFKKEIEALKAAQVSSVETAKIDANLVTLLKQEIDGGILQVQQYYFASLSKKKMNNSKAPNFDYENHKEGKTTLESLKGKYVYVDLWATWCGPCRAEIPSLKKMETDYHGKNIEFVSISVDADKDHDKWKAFVTEKQLSGIQLYAGKTPSEFITAFNVNTIPRFILIDPNGTVVDADAARPSDPKLRQQLDGLLK